MMAIGIKWEIEYRRGFDGSAANAKIASITPRQTNLCDVSYTYQVKGVMYTGVARRDCLFTLLDDATISYRTSRPECSRLTSGASVMNSSYDDLSTCDNTWERIRRQIMISFGVILMVLAGFGLCFTVLAMPCRVSNKSTESPSSAV